jgi:hypothetical protein
MRYWRITAQTMLCGMDQDYYIANEDEDAVEDIACILTDENAMEWWDPDDCDCEGLTEEEWLENTNYIIEEISEKEYLEYTMY